MARASSGFWSILNRMSRRYGWPSTKMILLGSTWASLSCFRMGSINAGETREPAPRLGDGGDGFVHVMDPGFLSFAFSEVGDDVRLGGGGGQAHVGLRGQRWDWLVCRPGVAAVVPGVAGLNKDGLDERPVFVIHLDEYGVRQAVPRLGRDGGQWLVNVGSAASSVILHERGLD